MGEHELGLPPFSCVISAFCACTRPCAGQLWLRIFAFDVQSSVSSTFSRSSPNIFPYLSCRQGGRRVRATTSWHPLMCRCPATSIFSVISSRIFRTCDIEKPGRSRNRHSCITSSGLSFDDHGMVPELLKKSCSCPLQMCLLCGTGLKHANMKLQCYAQTTAPRSTLHL